MKLLIFQFGNYAKAYQRFQDEHAETYRDQRISVDFVAGLSDRFDVTTVSIDTHPHAVTLAPGLHSVAITMKEAFSAKAQARLLQDIAPDLIICRTPNSAVLSWAKANDVPTLPVFADMFSSNTKKDRYSNWRLGRILRAPNFPCIANHSLNASRSLVDVLGLAPERVVAWEEIPFEENRTARTLCKSDPVSAFFAGAISNDKGVGDCIEAVAHLKRDGRELTFFFAGGGDNADFVARAKALGVENQIVFLGTISHESVRDHMRRASIVVVPSRHTYAEGLPNTISEALAARTPVIISDHPAFSSRFNDGQGCVIFPAADPVGLAGQIERVIGDAALYAKLSESSIEAHRALYVGLQWPQLFSAFLEDSQNQSGWVEKHSILGLEGGTPAS